MGAASNVILAKARAMYGRRIRPEQMEALLSCRSVPEICGYLKEQTAYAGVLRDTDENSIHRGHLEQLLRRKQEEEFLSLCRYENTVGAAFRAYLDHRMETEWLGRYLRLLDRGAAADFYWKYPPLLPARTRLDLRALSRAERYDELPALLDGTPYGEIFRKVPSEDGRVPLARAEQALQVWLRLELRTIIEHTRGEEKKQLLRLCGGMDDTENATRLYRLRRYFPEETRVDKWLLPSGGSLTKKEEQSLRRAATAEEVQTAFFRTRLSRDIPADKAGDVDEWVRWEVMHTAAHDMHFSVYPSVVLMAYILLMDVERSNLTTLIEGVRYSLSAERIRRMLIVA